MYSTLKKCCPQEASSLLVETVNQAPIWHMRETPSSFQKNRNKLLSEVKAEISAKHNISLLEDSGVNKRF